MSVTGLSASFTWLVAATTLLGVVLAPVAAAFAERASPRRVLQAANLLALLSTVALLSARTAGLAPGAWTAGLLVLTGVGFGLHWPAWAKALTTTAQTPKAQTRAAALLQLGTVAQYVVAPGIAALLLSTVDVEGVLMIDAALLVLATASALTLPATLSPAVAGVGAGIAGVGAGVVAGVGEAWAFLLARPQLLALQAFFFVSYLFGGVVVSLSTPLLLSLTDVGTAGLCLSVSGVGMLVGVGVGAVVGSWVRRRGLAVLGLEGVAGLCLVLMGAFPTVVVVTAAATVFLGLTGVSNTLSQALWQEAVPSHLQLRVFAIRRLLAWGALPVSYAAAGPIADTLAAAFAVDAVAGVHRSAGLAAVFVGAGAAKAVVSLLASRTRLRSIDDANGLFRWAPHDASPICARRRRRRRRYFKASALMARMTS
jgi:MFS family permease